MKNRNIDDKRQEKYLSREKAINELSIYYGDSKTKATRRKEILYVLINVLLKDGNYIKSFQEICKLIEIDRKSLYRYFPSKDDIISDVVYILVVEINAKKMEVSTEIYNDEKIKPEEKLKKTINMMLEKSMIRTGLIEIINYFDVNMYHVDDEKEFKKRYVYLMDKFKNENRAFAKIIKELYILEKLSNEYDVNYYIDTVELAVTSFAGRFYLKKSESKRYNEQYLKVYSEIIYQGIMK